jgi:glycosyltransferase involved in cell wall biosynthesis
MIDVEIVVPVYNEERVLADTVLHLHRFLASELPYAWRLTIADNASTDDTEFIGSTLAGELPCTRYLRLEAKGRGLALRTAWSQSPARVVAYMDADLSTDLRGLGPLLAPLFSGHSELAIGTRHTYGSDVSRSLKRSIISRSYNRLLQLVLHAHFSDAQCGFKAVRRDVVDELLAAVQDNGWFFDTELLITAERRGLRIHEVPVDWVDDPDSSVDILRTALTDLRGVIRLASPLSPLPQKVTRHERHSLPRPTHSA